jgi:MFS family permease
MAFLSPPKITTMEDAKSHRTYALIILVIVYIFNFIDRQIVNILQEDIKADLGLNDTQLGMMTGLTFAVVYCTMGIPVARIADSTSRKGVMTVSLALWSGFTALCGLATNYLTLLLARMGVGLGEAGGSPPAHAMISDLYEKEKRGRALAVYSAGLYAGTLLGYYLGGWLSEAMSWRHAFFVVGIPGVIFAVIAWTTLREPMRGLSGIRPSTEKVTFLQSFAKLWSLKAFPYYAIATGAGTFVTYGLGNWMPSFLPRTFGDLNPETLKYVGEWSMPGLQAAVGLCRSEMVDGVRQLAADCAVMNKTEIGLFYGTVSGVGGAIGTIGGGILADLHGAKDRRWFLWVPMWGKILGGPIFVLALLAPTPELALLLYFPGIILAAAYLGPSLAITHHLVPASMRAMSSAVLFFILNILGLGTGPFVVGLISDWITANGATLAETASWIGSTPELAKQFSLKWAMVAAVLITYPLCILWHLGAMRLPKGELDDDGNAPATDAVLTRSAGSAEKS